MDSEEKSDFRVKWKNIGHGGEPVTTEHGGAAWDEKAVTRGQGGAPSECEVHI